MADHRWWSRTGLAAQRAVALNAVKTSQPDGSVIGVCESGAMSANMWLFKSLSLRSAEGFRADHDLCQRADRAGRSGHDAGQLDEGAGEARPVSAAASCHTARRRSVRAGISDGCVFRKARRLQDDPCAVPRVGPAINELVAGRLDYFWTSFPSLKGFYENGQIKVLALGSAQRDPAFPKVPTTAEQELSATRHRFLVRLCARRPDAARDRQRTARRGFAKALQSKEVQAQYAAVGMQVHSTTPDEFKKLVVDDTARFKEIVESTGAKLD